MLGDELTRESQLLLHAAQMSFALPPDVYAIAQGSASDYRRYCYFITSTSGKNLLVGCPAYDEDLAEALDALGGVDSLLPLDGGKDAELWQYEFDCEIITSPHPGPPPKWGKIMEDRLAEDLLLLHIADGAMLLYEQHGGVLCCGDMFAVDADGRLISNQPNPEAIRALQTYPIAAILPARTQGGFITEGGAEALAMVSSRTG